MSGEEREPGLASWVVARLCDVAEIRLGKMLSPKAFRPDLIVRPYLRNENVRWGSIDLGDVKEMGFRVEELERYSVEPGDLLVCEGGEPGRAAVYRGNSGLMYQKALHRVRPHGDAISTTLLRYWLEHLALSGRLAPKIAQTTIQHLPLERFEAVEIPLPPRREQEAILSAVEQQMTRIEAGVRGLERAKAQLGRYHASVLKAACEGRLVPTEAALARAEGRDFEPAHALLDRILRARRAVQHVSGKRGTGEIRSRTREPVPPNLSNTSRLPEGWCWASIDMVGDLLLGRQRAPQYLLGKSPRAYLRVANVKDDRIDFSDLETMDFDEAHFEKYTLRAGDVLLSEGQSSELLGQSAIFRGEIEDLCFQKTLHRFRPIPNGPSSEYAQIVFRSHVKSGVFRGFGSITTNIAHLTLEKLKSVPFPLPPRAEQARIVAEVHRRLSIADELATTIDAALRRAVRLRQSILKRAFEGKLVPPDPTDEPASLVLERIRKEREAAAQAAPRTLRQRGVRRPRPPLARGL